MTSSSPKCVSQRVRRALAGQPCAVCTRPDDLEYDHIVPKCKGGSASLANIQRLCRVCNILKRDLGSNEAAALWIKENPIQFSRKQQLRTDRLDSIRRGEHIF